MNIPCIHRTDNGLQEYSGRLSFGPVTTLAARLRDLRKKRGLTQKAFGKLLGVEQSSISKWETGATTPDTSSLLKLAIAYAMPLDMILAGVDAKYDALSATNQTQDVLIAERQRADALDGTVTALTAHLAQMRTVLQAAEATVQRAADLQSPGHTSPGPRATARQTRHGR